MMKAKKRKWFVFYLAVAAFITTAVGIIAYASKDSNNIVNNQLHIADFRGDIEEKDFIEKQGINPGETVSKDVKIKNNGDTGLFVRVMVFPEIASPSSDPPTLLAANIGEEIMITLGTDWVDGKDGFYYYIAKVTAGSSTSSLFTTVEMASNIDISYDDADFDMQIKSETVTASSLQYRKAWWNKEVDTKPTDSNLAEIDSKLAAIVKGE